MKDTFEALCERRMKRRAILKIAGGLGATGLLSGCVTNHAFQSDSVSNSLQKGFQEVPQGLDPNLTIPSDHEYQVLIRWGDPIFEHSPPFDPLNQSEQSQSLQFGFNNDYIGYIPFPKQSSESRKNDEQETSVNDERGLMVVNHEFTNPPIMHPDVKHYHDLTFEQTKVDVVAHGLSVIEIKKNNGEWSVIQNSKFNRRITPYTPMLFSGPAAGSHRLITHASKAGLTSFGTYGNCAGGMTPWGTVLTAEENVDEYFTGKLTKEHAESQNYYRFGYRGKPYKNWSKHFERWDLTKNPNELNHVGWIVEVDPFDPESTPVKRTALGRCKHESCNININSDDRLIAYTGDDQNFEYIYRFVSDKKYIDEETKAASKHNFSLLDEGVLSVAKFLDDGTLKWISLVFGQGPLTPENQFYSQADVLIELRRAGDLVGATPMDRPEDIEVNPMNNHVYVMLTKNKYRDKAQRDFTNPRAKNKSGHILEMIPPNGDHAADSFKWEILLLAGNPKETKTNYHPKTTENGWLACPDNCAFDEAGTMWVSTDGAESFNIADGIWQIDVESPYRGLSRRFLRAPIGAEVCGPMFTPNNKTLFCAIQHPGEDSSFNTPSTRWPDFDPSLPPRPAVVAIRKKDGTKVGQ